MTDIQHKRSVPTPSAKEVEPARKGQPEFNSDTLVVVQTVQSTAFRNLFETLKDVLTDTNIIFEKGCMKLLTMDNNHCVLVSVKLNASSFEVYHCPERVLVGVNISNFFRLIKSIGTSDTLTLRLQRNDPNKLIIVIDNFDKNTSTTFRLNQLDIDEVRLEIPDTEFDSVLTMPSGDFQRICRDMATLSEVMEVSSLGRQLVLRAAGDFAEQTTVIGEKESGLFFTHSDMMSEQQNVFGKFSLKYLSTFSKANVLCGTVDLYLKKEYPLILSYSCASLGKLLFVLGPKKFSAGTA
mgnify:CR=1 FL=1